MEKEDGITYCLPKLLTIYGSALWYNEVLRNEYTKMCKKK